MTKRPNTTSFSLLFLGAAALTSACTVEPRPGIEPNCSAMDGYEFSVFQEFWPDPPDAGTLQTNRKRPDWFDYGDGEPNCLFLMTQSVPLSAPVCGSSATPGSFSYALEFKAQSCNYWGAGASHVMPSRPPPGDTILPTPTGYYDGTGYEGIAVWARTPGVSFNGVVLSLNDADTGAQTGNPVDPSLDRVPPSRCTPAPADATLGTNAGYSVANAQAASQQAAALSNGTTSTSSAVNGAGVTGGLPARIPKAGECGNAFQRVFTVTDQWQIYYLPFSTFYQMPYPNLIPSGFDPATLLEITVTLPKEAYTDIWFGNFSFYRHKTDGGT